MNPVMDNPKQAMRGDKGRSHPMGRLSERCPNTGWIIEEVKWQTRELCLTSYKKGLKLFKKREKGQGGPLD